MSDQIHTPAALSPGKDPASPSNRTHCGPQSRSACFGYTEMPFALPGTESFLGLPGRTQIIILSYLDIQYIKTVS